MRYISCPIRNRYASNRTYARTMPVLVAMMRGGCTPERVAQFVRQQQVGTSMRLSWAIEDKAEDGTFAAAVFDILCNS